MNHSSTLMTQTQLSQDAVFFSLLYYRFKGAFPAILGRTGGTLGEN